MTNYEYYKKQIKDIFIGRIAWNPCSRCPSFIWEKCPKSHDIICAEWVEKWLDTEAKEEEKMTDNKRTRGKIKNAIDCTVPESYVLKNIINALENQIPKKPDLVGEGYDDEGQLVYDTWVCPSCDTSYECDYDDYDFCPKCGQKIDWSEGND